MLGGIVSEEATSEGAPALSAKGKVWQMAPVDERAVQTLTQRHALPDLLAQLLVQRNVIPDDVEAFLSPRLRDSLPDPRSLKDMEAAAAHILQAVQDDKSIAVFADYDVDGATSGALLIRYLRHLGVTPLHHVPDRVHEGYGPNEVAIEKLAEQGAELIIFVDCGTTAMEPLTRAQELGLEVIVVDHHQAEPKLPPAVAVVNPNRLDEPAEVVAQAGHMAAVGVTFLLLVEMNRQLREAGAETADLMTYLDLVALGTVCDVVPLTGVNRALVKQGIEMARQQPVAGLAQLSRVANIEEPFSVHHLGFIVGPRLNAGGRVGASDMALRLLIEEDAYRARELAEMLDQNNRHRQKLEQTALSECLADVMAHADEQGDQKDSEAVVVASDRWHQGVIGLLASRLQDRFQKPSFVVTFAGLEGTGLEGEEEVDLGKGSARSIPGVDLGALVLAARQDGLLEAGGGHQMAAGFAVQRNKLPAFERFIKERLQDPEHAPPAHPILELHASAAVPAVTPAFLEMLENLAPFGQGNPTPRFMVDNVRISYARVLKDKHVACSLQDDQGQTLEAICFRCVGEPLGDLLTADRDRRLAVAGTLQLDEWQGRRRPKLFISDARVL